MRFMTVKSDLWSERENQQDAIVRYLLSILSQHVSGIMMPKTCWESIDNKHLTVASCWFSLSLHNLLTMHGHRNLKKKWFICNCRLCVKRRRATGENWPWRRRKPSIVPVFVWHFLNLLLQRVNGSLLSVLFVFSYPSGFGFMCWRNYSVRRQLCYWVLLEHTWIKNEVVLYFGIYKFEFCHTVWGTSIH